MAVLERLDALRTRWTAGRGVRVQALADGLEFANEGDAPSDASLLRPPRLPGAFKGTVALRVERDGDGGVGAYAALQIGLTRHSWLPLDSESRVPAARRCRVQLKLVLPARCNVRLRRLELTAQATSSGLLAPHLRAEGLLFVTRSFASATEPYAERLLLQRVQACERAGLAPVVFCASRAASCETVYRHAGVQVLRGSVDDLVEALSTRRYRKIVLHGLDAEIAHALDRSLANATTEVLIWSSGSNDPFAALSKLRAGGAGALKLVRLETTLRKFNRKRQVHWALTSPWHLERAQELLGERLERATLVPEPLDLSALTPSLPRPEETAARVAFIGEFHEEGRPAVELAVRTVLELSRRRAFEDLEFHFVGDGPLREPLLAPLGDCANVIVHRSSGERSRRDALGRCGIALVTSNQDSATRVARQAAAAGLAVITAEQGTAGPPLPPRRLAAAPVAPSLADAVERVRFDPGRYLALAAEAAAVVREQHAPERVLAAEVALIARSPQPLAEARPPASQTPGPAAPAQTPRPVARTPEQAAEAVQPTAQAARKATLEVGTAGPGPQPLAPGAKNLSVVVPVYNMERHLERCVCSMLEGPATPDLEVVIIDDGSRDGSLRVARALEVRFPDVVRVFEQPNGGHGAAINHGLRVATGRYVRLLDSDDWVDSLAFGQFLERLRCEDADCVLTDFSKDRPHRRFPVPKRYYSNLSPGRLYRFDDLADPRHGFQSWGPVLATATFKTDCLRRARLQLDEGMAYVDMEYDVLSLTFVETVRYYDLDVYRYLVGRSEQSVSRKSYEKRFREHERVVFRLCDYVRDTPVLSEAKRRYIVHNVIADVVDRHHIILGRWFGDWDACAEFDRRLNAYPFLRPLRLGQRRLLARLLSPAGRLAERAQQLLG